MYIVNLISVTLNGVHKRHSAMLATLDQAESAAASWAKSAQPYDIVVLQEVVGQVAQNLSATLPGRIVRNAAPAPVAAPKAKPAPVQPVAVAATAQNLDDALRDPSFLVSAMRECAKADGSISMASIETAVAKGRLRLP